MAVARRALRRLLSLLPGGDRTLRAIDFARADRYSPQKHLPGHYSSPLVDLRHLDGASDAPASAIAAPEPAVLPVSREGHEGLLDDLGGFVELHGEELLFSAGGRYRAANGWFGAADAALFAYMLHRERPRRVVEVGSGFSSAMLLDSADRFDLTTEMTFVEPFPERLEALSRPADHARYRLLVERIENVPLGELEALEDGDFLFLDGSHVLRVASDLNWTLFEILPRLRAGVWIHFHDVFWPFDYPRSWFERGFQWNEAYALRAFLSYNRAFRVEIFLSYLQHLRPDWFASAFRPDPTPASSLWLRKVA
ncbi:MAG: class I SAM-dependent methyltransferase [Acidobacteria bacterium]|nr:MAG: class I SAM-dependent methyltransferase [Acidobacteriota bacterium]